MGRFTLGMGGTILRNDARPGFVIGVVDDDISFREALEGLFGSFGFETRCFGSAEDFLRLARPGDFRCLILDVQMAGMSGLDLHDKVRASHPELPTIFITSQDDLRTRTRALDGGAVAIFGKPFDREALISTVESLRHRPVTG